jgi:hypothetical protein
MLSLSFILFAAISCKKQEFPPEGIHTQPLHGNTNKVTVADAGPNQTITLPLDSTYLDGSGSLPNGWTSLPSATFLWKQISGPSQTRLHQATSLSAGYNRTTAIVKDLIPGIYLFELQVSDLPGTSGRDTITVFVEENPQNVNTVTYHDLLWKAGDVYGLGSVVVSLTTSIRPDLFHSLNSNWPIVVYLKLDPFSAWTVVQYHGKDLYSYDQFPWLLWILCYPNDLSLVSKLSSIKVKFL